MIIRAHLILMDKSTEKPISCLLSSKIWSRGKTEVVRREMPSSTLQIGRVYRASDNEKRPTSMYSMVPSQDIPDIEKTKSYQRREKMQATYEETGSRITLDSSTANW